MKKTKMLILLAAFSAAVSARGQTNPVPATAPAIIVVTNVAVSGGTVISNAAAPPLVENASAPAASGGTNADSSTSVSGQPGDAAAPTFAPANGTNSLHLNFRGASLTQVLNYLSEAAGFIVVLETQPKGTVDVFSSAPVTREEAVNLLDQALKKNGFAAIRNGRTLTIVARDEAKTQSIPVFVGADPSTIPITDQIVTQIIPVRYVEVAQLVKDLQPLVSTQTTMTANDSGNEIVITDTQANIHKVAEIIKAIDAGAEDITVMRVFKLNYADPTEMADLLENLFPDDSRSGGSSAPVQFGGGGGFRSFFRGGGFGGGGFGGGAPGGAPGGNSANNQNQRIKKRARVVAVADPRTSSLVVSAAKDLMDQIDGVISELDSNPAKKKVVRVFKINNADPQELLPVLQDIFQKNGTQTSRNNSSQSALQQRSQSQQTSSSSSSSSSGSRGGGGGGSRSSFGP